MKSLKVIVFFITALLAAPLANAQSPPPSTTLVESEELGRLLPTNRNEQMAANRGPFS